MPTALVGDPLRIGQVLTNLGSNAVKFTPEGGAVRIEAECIGSDATHTALRFSVHDTGIGIPADQLGKLFRPFVQTDSSTTRKYGGTGLGLVIARQLVECMGGEITVQSAPGQGSIFTVTLQLQRQTGQPSERRAAMAMTPGHAAGQAPDLAGARLLLVEDNLINQEVTQDLLALHGIDVQVAHNGLEALAMLEHERYDGVLMDCQMPVMDGYMAARRIREQPRWADLPIIALTADAMVGDRERVLACGMNDHVGKPIDLRRLFDVLRRWIRPAHPPGPQAGDGPNGLSGTSEAASALAAIGLTTSRSPSEARPSGSGMGSPPAAAAPAASGKAVADASFPPLPGVDLSDALRRLAGKADLLRRLLRQFRDTHVDFEARYRQARAAGDASTAKRIAHTLKGTSGTLAMPTLRDAAARLESASSGDDESVDAAMGLVRAELTRVIEGLAALDAPAEHRANAEAAC